MTIPIVTGSIVHWFDFICPFCYIAQDRNKILRDAGLEIIELPMQIHPEIGPGGAVAPVRTGPMYDNLAREAQQAGLELNWSPRISYSAYALAAAETVRTQQPAAHEAFTAAVFNAYFARGEDIEDSGVLTRCGQEAGLQPEVLAVIARASETRTPEAALEALAPGMDLARRYGVTGTPSWLINDQLVTGLRARELFTKLAGALTEPD